MANFLEDIGRNRGALTGAVTGLANLALNIRNQQNESQLVPLKQEALRTDVESSRVNLNIKRAELQEINEKEKLGNRPIEVTALEKVWNNPEQFKKDYDYMKSSGLVSTLSDGSEVIIAKDLKRFKDEVQSTVAYKQSFNTANLKRWSGEQAQLKNQVDVIEQEYLQKGKTVEDAQKDKRIQPLISALEVATVNKTKAMLNDKAIADLYGKMVSAKIPVAEINQFFLTGDTKGLVAPSTGGGKMSDFERAYQQHISIDGNEAVTRAEFKTGAFAIPKGGLSDNAVLDHFTQIAMTELEGAVDAQLMFQRFSDNQKDGMSRIDAFNDAKEWGLRKATNPNLGDDFSSLWDDSVNDDLFTIHDNE